MEGRVSVLKNLDVGWLCVQKGFPILKGILH